MRWMFVPVSVMMRRLPGRRRDVAVLRLEVTEDVRDLVGVHVAQPVHARDVAILGRAP
jgi:hypothetical protein